MGLATSITPTPAMAAADQYLVGRCTDGNFAIEITARHRTSETQHLFTQLSWRISGNVGSKNTVRFSFVQDANPDIVFKAFNYEGGKTGSRNIWVMRPNAHKVFVRFGARFDTSASSDPGCTYNTRGI